MAVKIESTGAKIKNIPVDPDIRRAIHKAALDYVGALDMFSPPAMSDLNIQAEILLNTLGLPLSYSGFTMVAISNAYWRERFEAVPYSRRLLLLPHCLSKYDLCRGSYDASGLHCAGCGSCSISELIYKAQDLGYHVITAEGTSSVLYKLLEGGADAVLGVACLDSLEKSHARVAQVGIPHVAIPLLTDGCRDTVVEVEEVLQLLNAKGPEVETKYTSLLPLMRESFALFDNQTAYQILEKANVDVSKHTNTPIDMTDNISIDWLLTGGKRLRPFVTIAAYVVSKYGIEMASPDVETSALVPDSVRSLAVAIEALHKASLVHDDVEDQEQYRYGRKTVYTEHGLNAAINVGDYLVGLGYSLISLQSDVMGASTVAKMMVILSQAHLELCRGQGAELLWDSSGKRIKPLEALRIYALKTSPAFEAALRIGLAAAEMNVDEDTLHRFCVYLGEAYQIDNDMEDWKVDKSNHIRIGGDILSGKPTLVSALAYEAGISDDIQQALEYTDTCEAVKSAAMILESAGIFRKARDLSLRLRSKALDTAEEIDNVSVSALLKLLVRIIIPERMG